MRVPDIVKLAKTLGLDCISITDHDTMANLPEVLAAGEKYGMTIIPGAELSAYDEATGRKVHILCYNAQDPELITRECRPFSQERDRANRESVERVRAAGYAITIEDVREYVAACGVPRARKHVKSASGGIQYHQHVMHALMDRGYTNTIYGELYEKLYGKHGIAVARSRYMTAAAAIELAHAAGGLAVLAHPYQYDSMEILPRLVGADVPGGPRCGKTGNGGRVRTPAPTPGLDGIEHIHHTQTPERRAAVAEAAERYGLFLTGGTDFHGMYSEKTLCPGGLEVLLPDTHPLFART
jgi:predicted metal-dependent phosphoesterase TrpH